MGLLQVQGTLDITQFWPKGTSDADTAKVLLDLTANPFQFQSAPGQPFKVTHALDQAMVADNPVVKKNTLTIRLQAIDASELHYRPADLTGKTITQAMRDAFKLVDKEYRQPYGETAVVALLARVSRKGVTTLPCTVQTDNVATPNDVFDKYGRFIGDIIVKVQKTKVNLNQWLVAQGHALPTFYVSMSPAEIKTYLAAAKKGRAKKKVWKLLQQIIPPFDPSLLFRRKATPDPVADKGPVILPKLFRRQCTWWAAKQAGATADEFVAYIAKGKTKTIVITDDFLATGKKAKKYTLGSLLAADGTFTRAPDEIVFLEDPSKLIGPDQKPVLDW